MFTTCSGCPAVIPPADATAHERDLAAAVPAHRVTVWDSPSSQVPRALWPRQAGPAGGPPVPRPRVESVPSAVRS